ncbi:transglutaminase family protein [Chloroflexota bacterium]
MEAYLGPTPVIDCNDESVKQKASQLTQGNKNAVEKAINLFRFVRDEIGYNFWNLSDFLEDYRASATMARGEGFCIQKAIVLAALSRAAGIPARLRFAVIRNPLASDKVKELLGGDLFVSHGYNELYLGGKWLKVAPTYDRQLCEGKRLVLVEFDGVNHAVLPSHSLDGEPHIEYVLDRGHYDDLPLDEVINWRIEGYGADYLERVKMAVEARNARL